MMKFKQMIKSLFALPVVVSILTGCASLPDEFNIKSPKAHVVDSRIVGLDLEKIDFEVALKITNPNFFPLFEVSSDIRVYTQGRKVLELSNVAIPHQIPAGQSTIAKVPVQLVFANVIKLVPDLIHEPEMDYKIEVDLSIPVSVLGVIQLPLTHQGSLPIPKPPRISIASASIDKISLSTVSFYIDLDILNTNKFDVANLGGNLGLAINSKSIGSTALSVPSIQSGEKQTTRLNMSFSPSQLGLSLFGAKQLSLDVKGLFNWTPPYGEGAIANNLDLDWNLPL